MILTSAAELHKIPERIVSIVPSQTELLADLGLDKQVIGITKFCIHPAEWFHNKTRIGGTKNLNISQIINLNPDLILANKEENTKAQVEVLTETIPVYVTDISDYASAVQSIKDVGILTGTTDYANQLINNISRNFNDLPQFLIQQKAAYLIWKDPWMTVGGDTFISDMMKMAGFENVFASRHRYPIVDIENIRESGCEVILLSSEPYPFKQKYIDELQHELPGMKIILVDGEMFSWYGSRMLQAPAYFASIQSRL